MKCGDNGLVKTWKKHNKPDVSFRLQFSLLKRFKLRRCRRLGSNMTKIDLDYPIFDRTGDLRNKICVLHKGAKSPQCNSEFINKIELRSNIVPPTSPK